MSDSYDIAIIGGGPGGYVAALRAAQNGKKVAVIDKRRALGGTCLNVGCIPSKALLQSTAKFWDAAHEFADHGIQIGGLNFDLGLMQDRKDQVVAQTVKGIEFLCKKHKVTFIHGTAKFLSATRLAITADTGENSEIQAENIIIATGSTPTSLPGIAIDESKIVSSTGALALKKVPGHLVVIGAGVIGLELGSVWRRLGAKVTVIEFLPHITPSVDQEIAKILQKELTKQGFVFKLSTRVVEAVTVENEVALHLESDDGKNSETITADCVLVAVGRKPCTEGLGLEEIGIALDPRGRIQINDHWQTNVPSIYAIGDVVAGPMLAHKASEEGVAVADLLAGRYAHIYYDAIPAVVYTNPEIAQVGYTQEQLKSEDRAYKLGKFPFTANARARANGNTAGMVKILADAATDRVLGVHIIGHEAGEMILTAVAALEFGASAEDIARLCAPHPTLSEAIKEAALAVDGAAIHI
ncbi:MAG: dihydrolipoyl dehydrogenase [Candidatus Symbiobacter sp.]|nr:dihydrolipoyl dehydrogenase [Candidatus Symbiobacter sp.]